MNKQDLIDFENDIQDIYKTGAIRGPIHLRDGNEEHLIKVFENVKSDDYVFTTWASHLECLLKGVPPEDVKRKILEGKSITLMFPKHKVYSSAIVGGICPIAVGTAWAIKKRGGTNKVWAFIGDMTAMTGIASESIRYSLNHDLPITWVIGDNGKSVGTITDEVWGESCWDCVRKLFGIGPTFTDITYWEAKANKLIYYKYKLSYPHSGVGQFVSF
jgi:pyruvate dehydrogenase E1 component alpha subunit